MLRLIGRIPLFVPDLWRFRPSSESSSSIATSLVEVGPLSVLLNASKLQFYDSGVFNPDRCNPGTLNHAVLNVRFGTDATDGDYFIIKNSWGEKWGEQGYVLN